MLIKENFSESHIRELQHRYRQDPALIERSIYAFGLLEALVKVGMPFIFKGGTCLMLLLKDPQRLSIDIDISVENTVDVEEYLKLAATIFPFIHYEEQKREKANNRKKTFQIYL